MSIFDKFKGLISNKPKDDKDSEKRILVYDKDGNQYTIPKSYWISNVLPKEIEKEWNNPDNLYNVIVSCLKDEAFEIAIKPALHLFDIDKDRQRACLILGLVYLKDKQLDKAETIFNEAIDKYPDYGYFYTNLAKVYADKGDESLCYNTLWKAITIDPNQENAIDWIGAIHFEKGGHVERLKIFENIAMLPNSWRAQLWIARYKLENGKFDEAKAIYKSILNSASQNDVAIMMIIGDLGNNGRIDDIFEIVYPIFDLSKHGINAGLNLVQACIQSNRIDLGHKILNELRKLDRLDYIDILNKLENQLNTIKSTATNTRS